VIFSGIVWQSPGTSDKRFSDEPDDMLFSSQSCMGLHPLDEKISLAKFAIESAKESRNNPN